MSQARPPVGLSLFGRPRVTANGEAVVLSAPPRTIVLLAYVGAHGARGVDRREAASALWPDLRDQTARAEVRRHLYYLERALRVAAPALADPLQRSGHASVGLNPLIQIDTIEFERALREGRLEDALHLYTGDLLETLADEPWIDPLRTRLRAQYNAAFEAFVATARAQGCALRAIAEVRRFLTLDPYHEGALRTLVELLHETGDRSGVDLEYRRFAERLRADLDTDPLPQTRALYERLSATTRAPRPEFPLESTSFVGRNTELQALGELLEGSRSIAITGPPGVGKTRLAVRFAAVHGAAYRDGARDVRGENR